MHMQRKRTLNNNRGHKRWQALQTLKLNLFLDEKSWWPKYQGNPKQRTERQFLKYSSMLLKNNVGHCLSPLLFSPCMPHLSVSRGLRQVNVCCECFVCVTTTCHRKFDVWLQLHHRYPKSGLREAAIHQITLSHFQLKQQAVFWPSLTRLFIIWLFSLSVS